MEYYVVGLGGPVATAGADECFSALWNPSSTRRIKMLSCTLYMRDFDIAGNTFYVTRITARGTPGSTVTPNADNSREGDSAPPSGALLDLAEYSAQPTRASPELKSPFAFPAGASGAEGSGFLFEAPRGIWIPPGTGVAICEKNGNTFGGNWDTGFVFED